MDHGEPTLLPMSGFAKLCIGFRVKLSYLKERKLLEIQIGRTMHRKGTGYIDHGGSALYADEWFCQTQRGRVEFGV